MARQWEQIDEGTNTREYIPTIETRSSAVAGYILVAKELVGENSSRKLDRGRGVVCYLGQFLLRPTLVAT